MKFEKSTSIIINSVLDSQSSYSDICSDSVCYLMLVKFTVLLTPGCYANIEGGGTNRYYFACLLILTCETLYSRTLDPVA